MRAVAFAGSLLVALAVAPACTAILGIEEPGGGAGDDGSGMCVGVDFDTDEQHCGGCNDACSTNHGTPTCGGGECTIACTGSFRDCTGGPRADGCETDIDSDPLHCGFCGMPCPTEANANATCAPGGQCGLECKPLFGDCTGGPDVCETSLASDGENCGACGKSCLGGGCSGGKCQVLELTTSSYNPGALAVDDQYVYFVRRKPALPYDLMRVAKDGSGTPEALGTVMSESMRLYVEDGFLYYMDGGAIRRVDTTPPADAGQLVVNTYELGDWVVDGGFVYECSVEGMPAALWLRKTAVTPGSPPVPLTTTPANCAHMVADATQVYWIDTIGPMATDVQVSGMRKDGTGSKADYGTVCNVDVRALAQDDDELFVVSGCQTMGRITRIDKETAVHSYSLPGGELPMKLIADGTHFYTAGPHVAQEYRVLRYDAATGSELVVYSGPSATTEIDFLAQDATAIYFSEKRGKILRKWAK